MYSVIPNNEMFDLVKDGEVIESYYFMSEAYEALDELEQAL